MRPLIDLLSGFVAEHLGWTDDNVLCRLQFLQRESPESNFFLCQGKGKRSFKEQVQGDKWVTVHFQENASCDGAVMEYWAQNYWKPCVEEESLLIVIMLKARTRPHQHFLKGDCNTTPVFVPAGCINIVQPLDASYSASFKKKVDSAVAEHLQNNLDSYLNANILQQAITMNEELVGQAWNELTQNREKAVGSFKKYMPFPLPLMVLRILKFT